ncbi:MAG: VOC family protein [Hyphomicrobiaceae bacterium]
MHGHIYWTELITSDPDAVQAFYGETLGWTFDAMPMPDGSTYWIIMMDEEVVGGMMDLAAMQGLPPDTRSHWFTYVAADDVERRMKTVTRSGGTIVRPMWDLPGIGRLAIVRDPSGALLGWIEPADDEEDEGDFVSSDYPAA